MNRNTEAFSYLAFFAASGAILQIAIAVAIVMLWGWLALLGYAFVGTFINGYAMSRWQYKLVP